MTSFVICSSMRNLSDMRYYNDLLKSHGHTVWMPTPFDTHKYKEIALDLQEIARPQHFLKIKNLPENGCVLVVNKGGYIGYGTFAEIAYASALRSVHGHQIRILTTEPVFEGEPYYEETAVFGLELFDQKEFGIDINL